MTGLTETGPVAVLASIAASAVGALIWVVKRRNGNGNGHDQEDRDRIVRSLAYIEEHRIEMPGNWRDQPFGVSQIAAIDARISHKRRSDAMQFGILAALLRKGHIQEAAGLLEALERDAKDQI